MAKWVVGPEHDGKLFARLSAALKMAGCVETERWSGVAGSQDVSHWKFRSAKGELVVEAETYAGLTVEGPDALIAELKASF